MKKINCPNCGAEGKEGSTCQYCGSHIAKADLVKHSAMEKAGNGSAKKIYIVETFSSKEKVEDNVKKSFSYIARAYGEYLQSESNYKGRFYWVAPLPFTINPDSFILGNVRKIYLPFYSIQGEYKGIWIDNQNKSGNYFGNYALLKPALKSREENPLSYSLLYPGFEGTHFSNGYYWVDVKGLRAVERKDLKKEGYEICPIADKPEDLTTSREFENERQKLIEIDACTLLDPQYYGQKNSTLKAAKVKFDEPAIGIAYVSYWLVPVTIDGVTKEYFIGEHVNRMGLLRSLDRPSPFPLNIWELGGVGDSVRDFLGRFLMGEKDYKVWCNSKEAEYREKRNNLEMEEGHLKSERSVVERIKSAFSQIVEFFTT